MMRHLMTVVNGLRRNFQPNSKGKFRGIFDSQGIVKEKTCSSTTRADPHKWVLHGVVLAWKEKKEEKT